MKSKEIEYLQSLFIDVKKSFGDLNVPFCEGKVILGITGDGPDNKFFQCKSIINTILNLDKKIVFSLNHAIEFSYSDEVINNFNIIGSSGGNEFLAYYFIENAMYRTSSLWDCLAQLYNLHYSIGVDKDRVHYKSFFNKAISNPLFQGNSNICEIKEYLNEDDDSDCKGRWKGNHSFIKDYRNQLTHRNSPDELSLSEYDINFKHHPTLVLKRLIEDYNIVINFLIDIVDEIQLERKGTMTIT